MNNLINKVIEAKLILVPKGDDSQPCLRDFEKATGLKVPEFKDRQLEVKSGDVTFIKVKGRDIPSLIAAGFGDIGLTGSDSCEDYIASDNSVQYQAFGAQMCRFVLLAPANKAATVRKQLDANKNYLAVATSFPKLLNKCAVDAGIKLAPTDITVSGSVEIMPRLFNVPLVADLVASGATAKANGLVEVKTLMDVYPALVIKTADKKSETDPTAYPGIARIDETLNQRRLQLNDQAVNSYTLGLMRDSNKAGKKAGEEFGEVLMAIFGDGSVKDCESEIADLIYAQMVAAYSRKKPVSLSNIISILVERNKAASEL